MNGCSFATNTLGDLILLFMAVFVCGCATWFVMELVLWKIGFFDDDDGDGGND